MRRVKKSAIVAYTPIAMYRLVDDIERYPEFLPWCTGAELIERTEYQAIARLELSKGGVSKHFTTKNTLDPGRSVKMDLVDGPFRSLDGRWEFLEIGSQGCEIRLQVEFEFTSFLVELAFGQFFEQTCNSLVDAFTERAKAVYGDA